MAGRCRTALVFLALLAAGCGGAAPVSEETAEEAARLTPDEAVAAERAALDRCGAVSAQGYCGVRFGMPTGEASRPFR
jgi:hypothetical protein